MTARARLALIATLLLAACSAGGSSSAPSAQAVAGPTSAPVIPAVTATAGPGQTIGTLQIVIQRGKTTGAVARRTQFVSPSAISIGLVVNGGAPIYADVSANSALCTTSGTTETCTIPVPAPAGSVTIAMSFYDGPNGTGNLLGSGTGTTTVTLGTPWSISIPIAAVVGSVSFAITPATLQGPAASTATLSVTALDADGNAITGSAPFSTPITMSDNDTTGGISLSATAFTKPTDTITVNYSGAGATTSTTFTTTSLPTASVTPATLAIPPPHQSLFVVDSNTATEGVYVFAPGANGNAAPIREITGANTGISNPWGIALDASGDIYVSNNSVASIEVFAPDANGNVAPIRTISGTSTMLAIPLVARGLAFDSSGNLWAAVPHSTTPFTGGYIVEYPAGANGNVAPMNVLSGPATLTDDANTVAFDSAGGMHVAAFDNTNYPTALLTFPGGSSGNTAPTLDIHGTSAFGSNGTFQMAFDANGNQYVVVEGSGTGGVLGWPLTATGNVSPPISLFGTNTNLNSHTRGIGFDSAGYLYVSVQAGGVGLPVNPPNSIFVFAPGANGNVAPVRTISGSNIPAQSFNNLTISP